MTTSKHVTRGDFEKFLQYFNVQASGNPFRDVARVTSQLDESNLEQVLINVFFDNYDTDGSQSLEKTELYKVIHDIGSAYGCEILPETIEHILAHATMEDRISKEQFKQVVAKLEMESRAQNNTNPKLSHSETYNKKMKEEFEPILRVLGITPTGNLFVDLQQIAKADDNMAQSIMSNFIKYSFEIYDTNHDQKISFEELCNVVRDLNDMFPPAKQLSQQELLNKTQQKLAEIDLDQNGYIDIEEFGMGIVLKIFDDSEQELAEKQSDDDEDDSDDDE